jgi:hypothetical protein
MDVECATGLFILHVGCDFFSVLRVWEFESNHEGMFIDDVDTRGLPR